MVTKKIIVFVVSNYLKLAELEFAIKNNYYQNVCCSGDKFFMIGHIGQRCGFVTQTLEVGKLSNRIFHTARKIYKMS